MSITIESEFRYVVQWFIEWSEFQREDFVPIFIELFQKDLGVVTNGLIHSTATATLNDRPMSLFQCRIKLIREWCPQWSMELKNKLKEKIMEIDERVGEKLMNHLKMHNGENSTANSVNGNEEEAEAEAETAPEVMTATEPVNVASNDELANNRLSALVECETPVDDDDDDVTVNDEQADEEKQDGNADNIQQQQQQCDQNLCINEPDQPVSMQQPQAAIETLVA